MKRISRTYNKLLTVLLALLGFSCGDTIIEQPTEYGTPFGMSNAKGIAVSETDEKPIEGIRAVLKNNDDINAYSYGIDTVFTDNKGVFNLKGSKYDFPHQKLYVELSDIDGEKNGLFKDTTVVADFSNEKYTGGDGKWYEGEAEKDLGIIKLEEKQAE